MLIFSTHLWSLRLKLHILIRPKRAQRLKPEKTIALITRSLDLFAQLIAYQGGI